MATKFFEKISPEARMALEAIEKARHDGSLLKGLSRYSNEIAKKEHPPYSDGCYSDTGPYSDAGYSDKGVYSDSTKYYDSGPDDLTENDNNDNVSTAYKSLKP